MNSGELKFLGLSELMFIPEDRCLSLSKPTHTIECI